MPSGAAVASMVFAQLYSLFASVVFFCIFLILSGLRENAAVWLIPALAVLGAASLFPRPLVRVVNAVLHRMGKPVLPMAISTKDALRFIGLYMLWWGITGIAFGLFVASVAGWGRVDVAAAAGMFAVAYAAGFLALFAPGGIGVREGVLAAMLPLPFSVAVVIAGLARLLMTAIEAACVLPLFLRGKRYGEAVAEKDPF
jgi:hypothetical protein